MEKQPRFREWFTSTGTLVLAGRNSKNNEELVAQAGAKEIVLHTALPGSPFVNIKGVASNDDIRDAALLCAKYSAAWRDTHNDVKVHVFHGADINKSKNMKEGTFGVKKLKVIIAKKADVERI